jgi:hypothetical protein
MKIKIKLIEHVSCKCRSTERESAIEELQKKGYKVMPPTYVFGTLGEWFHITAEKEIDAKNKTQAEDSPRG